MKLVRYALAACLLATPAAAAAPVKKWTAPPSPIPLPNLWDPLHLFPQSSSAPAGSSLFGTLGGMIAQLQKFSTSDLTAALADAESVIPVTAGTCYAVGDVLPLSGGAIVTVATVGATGNILTVTLSTAGLFPSGTPVAPPLATAVTKGTGATFSQNDTVAATCWATLLPVVSNSLQNPLPQQPGIFLAIQKARDLADNGSTLLQSVQNGPINTACAPVVLTSVQTVNGLALKGAAAAAAIAVVVPK